MQTSPISFVARFSECNKGNWRRLHAGNNSTCAFLLPVKLNVSEISRVYTVIKHIAHFLFFHYCYPARASAEERVYGMIDPISLRLRSGSYRGSYWNKPLPRIQKHFPESKTHPRIQKSGAPNGNFRENICSEDDLRTRIFGTFAVKFLACLPLLGFSNIYKMV